MGSNACRRKWKGPHSSVVTKETNKGKAVLRDSDGDGDISDEDTDDGRPVKKAGRRSRANTIRKK